MSAALGEIRKGTVQQRLLAFFETNPDEELTERQAEVKLACSAESIKEAVLRLVRAGKIEKVKVIRLPAKGRAS